MKIDLDRIDKKLTQLANIDGPLFSVGYFKKKRKQTKTLKGLFFESFSEVPLVKKAFETLFPP